MAEIIEKIKKESKSGLVLCFAGVGSSFAKKNDQTSLIIAKKGTTILVDIGTTIPGALARKGVPLIGFDYYHITHSHADHCGGLEELLLLSRYHPDSPGKPKIIIASHYQDILWEKTLKGGCEHNEDGLLKFSDLAQPIRPEWIKVKPREMYEIEVGGINLIIFRTAHIPGMVSKWENAFWSTGLVIDKKVIFTADTRYDATLFSELNMRGIKAIFHDCQLFDPGAVHASYNELSLLPTKTRKMMHLTHYGDTYENFDPEKDGFAGFAKPWEIYKF